MSVSIWHFSIFVLKTIVYANIEKFRAKKKGILNRESVFLISSSDKSMHAYITGLQINHSNYMRTKKNDPINMPSDNKYVV